MNEGFDGGLYIAAAHSVLSIVYRAGFVPCLCGNLLNMVAVSLPNINPPPLFWRFGKFCPFCEWVRSVLRVFLWSAFYNSENINRASLIIKFLSNLKFNFCPATSFTLGIIDNFHQSIKCKIYKTLIVGNKLVVIKSINTVIMYSWNIPCMPRMEFDIQEIQYNEQNCR